MKKLLQHKEKVIHHEVFTEYEHFTEWTDVSKIFDLMLQIGYLTVTEEISHSQLSVKIPNTEIYQYFMCKVNDRFSRNNSEWLQQACELEKAFVTENVSTIERIMHGMLYDFFSLHDMNTKGSYHNFLKSVLQLSVDNKIQLVSKIDNDECVSVLVLLDDYTKKAVIIGLKRALDFDDLEQSCQETLSQISAQNYSADYQNYDISEFGIACYRKNCLVK